MGRKDGSDDTVVVRRQRGWRRHIPVIGATIMVLGAVFGALNLWRHTPTVIVPAVLAPPLPPPPVAAIVRPPVIVATEAEILADQPTDLTLFRFKANPAIIVLDFASLADQAQMLNRMAVFEEKDGYPHDRLLNDDELDKAIRGGGDDPATFYYGHDYRAAALVRFFAAADRDHVALTPQEGRLRALIAQFGWTGPDAAGALISLPRLAADATIDAQSRATILRHELSHGEYFTNPAYVASVRRFWNETMTEDERARFRTFLIADHYDGKIEDLIVNEAQAYLMHTPDARFFAAAFVGLPQARIDALRVAFVQGMPAGWLRDVTMPPAAVVPARVPRRRRRRYGCAAVSNTRASAARRAPRFAAASTAALRSAR